MALPIRGKTARPYRNCRNEVRKKREKRSLNELDRVKSLQKFSTRVLRLRTKCSRIESTFFKCLVISMLTILELASCVHRDACPKVQGHAEACPRGGLD